MLGTLRVWWTPPPATSQTGDQARDITAGLAPRQRELLVFLALHPDGVTRDTLIARFWDETTPTRSTNAFNTALTRLRRALETATDATISDLVLTGDGHYRLDPHLTDVDYWRFGAPPKFRTWGPIRSLPERRGINAGTAQKVHA